MTIERETYGFFEWLGDVGGLFDGMRIFGALVVSPLALLKLKAQLMNSFYYRALDGANGPSRASGPDEQKSKKKSSEQIQSFVELIGHKESIRAPSPGIADCLLFFI